LVDEGAKLELVVNVEAGEAREPENNVLPDEEEVVGEKEEVREEGLAAEVLKVEEKPVEEEVPVIPVIGVLKVEENPVEEEVAVIGALNIEENPVEEVVVLGALKVEENPVEEEVVVLGV
jgi:hypothetical protein